MKTKYFPTLDIDVTEIKKKTGCKDNELILLILLEIHKQMFAQHFEPSIPDLLKDIQTMPFKPLDWSKYGKWTTSNPYFTWTDTAGNDDGTH